jgi:putative oxidoreductase
MTDHTLTGEQAMSRLADRLATLTPPAPALELSRTQAVSMPRSPAVAAAMQTSARISARAAERAQRSRSVTGVLFHGLVAAVPYAVVALALRLVIARLFFFDGQSRVEGMRLPLTWQNLDFSFVLPMQVKAETVTAFLTQVPPLPIPPVFAAWVIAGAEFVFPILLMLGLMTRFSALALLGLTVVFQLFLAPQALWTAHIYWASMLLVLISLGPGQISIDAILRFITRR